MLGFLVQCRLRKEEIARIEFMILAGENSAPIDTKFDFMMISLDN